MSRNARRMTALAALALGLITTVMPGTASASAMGDNSNATVWGPQEGWLHAQAADIPCPVGAICLYKDQTDVHFVLPHCTTYALDNGNGAGSWFSLQTGGQVGYIQDQYLRPLDTVYPNQANPNYDFTRAYYVKPC